MTPQSKHNSVFMLSSGPDVTCSEAPTTYGRAMISINKCRTGRQTRCTLLQTAVELSKTCTLKIFHIKAFCSNSDPPDSSFGLSNMDMSELP